MAAGEPSPLRLAPITAFVGLNGAGKSLAAVEFGAVSSWGANRIVVSNMPLSPARVGFREDLFIPLQSWRDLSRLGVHDDPDESITRNRPCTLILDEINAALPARQFGAVPPELVRVLHQMRKHDVMCCWTSPAWDNADKMLRQVTRMVVVCRGRFPDPWQREDEVRFFPSRKRNSAGKALRVGGAWLPNRLFRFSAYAAEDFENFSVGVPGARPQMLWQRFYWRQRHLGHRAYDTAAAVRLLDHLDATGVCAVCDGQRSRHRCKCAPLGGGKPASAGDPHPHSEPSALHPALTWGAGE